MSAASPFAAAGQLPGWFGKLPGLGDFAHRRLPEDFREHWDQWLQGGLLQLRQRHADWTARYLEGSLWFFVLAPGVAGTRAWAGLLMPSVDGVGRYFPFTVAAELAQPPQELPPEAWPALAHWWQPLAQAALAALDQDLDAAGFDALLARETDGGTAAPGDASAPDWPADGQSLWLTDPADAATSSLRTAGLPRGARFDRLFGFAEEDAGLPALGTLQP